MLGTDVQRVCPRAWNWCTCVCPSAWNWCTTCVS